MSLTHNQTVRLLAYLAAHDQRTVGEEDILVWREASELHRWTLEEAQFTVRRLSNEPRAYRVQPSDVTAVIRAARQDAALRAETEQLKAAKAAIAAPVAAALERGFGNRTDAGKHLGSGHVDAIYEQQGWSHLTRAAVRHGCPWCREQAGRPCTKLLAGGVVDCADPHPSRLSLIVACVQCGADTGARCEPVQDHPHHDRAEDALGAVGKQKRKTFVRKRRESALAVDWRRESDFLEPSTDDDVPEHRDSEHDEPSRAQA